MSSVRHVFKPNTKGSPWCEAEGRDVHENTISPEDVLIAALENGPEGLMLLDRVCMACVRCLANDIRGNEYFLEPRE